MSASRRIEPRKHQIEAHSAMTAALDADDRALATMACGSGKTFTQAFLARHFIEKSDDPAPVIVCFVPNRALVQQNAENFRNVFEDSVDMFGVFSETDTLSEHENGGPHFDFPKSTDPEIIRAGVAASRKPRIVFSTYQSVKACQAALTDADGLQMRVPLSLFDEAHRTAGDKDFESLFAFALSDDNFPIEKRAFFTATPRIETERESTAKNISMDDETIYGRHVYDYPFSRALEDGAVVDYRLFAPIVSVPEIEQIADERGIVLDPENEAARKAEMRKIVAEIALSKVMEETGHSRFLTYHRSVADAEDFSDRLRPAYGGPGATIDTISAKTDPETRKILLRSLAEGSSIISNCQALVEGIDAPGLQGAIFVDPRSSVVDVIQAVGRVARPDKSDPSKIGSVVVPLIYDPERGDDQFSMASDQGFRTLIQVALAMKSSKDSFQRQVSDASRAAGRGETPGEVLGGLEVISGGSALGAEDVERLKQAVALRTFDTIQDRFAYNVGRLEAHLDRHGRLPDANFRPLYEFMRQARHDHAEGRLGNDQTELLEQIKGWSWLGKHDRKNPIAIAAHIASCHRRTGQMPDRHADSTAESELGHHLFRMESAASRMIARADDWNEVREGANWLDEKGLLFSMNNTKPKPVLGRFLVQQENGKDLVYFQPGGEMPYFTSGYRGEPAVIRIHAAEAERERIRSFGSDHQVRVSLVRAGIEKSYKQDGKIAAWYDGAIHRDAHPPSNTTTYVLHRFQDAKAAGAPAPTASNVREGLLSLEDSVIDITADRKTPPITIESFLKRVRAIQQRHADGGLPEKTGHRFDVAPGFSWVDGFVAKTTLAPAIDGIVRRHGAEILSSVEARRGDNGLANTLRTTDKLLASRKARAKLADHIDKLRDAGHLDLLMQGAQAASREKAARTSMRPEDHAEATAASR